MSESMREDFEAWAGPAGYDVINIGSVSGDYIGAAKAIAWQAWQASRAALCVELPELKDMRFTHPCKPQRVAHNDAVEACRSAIHAAGVKTR